MMELFLELSRKCNLKCAHCLRGPAQRKNMSREVMLAAYNKAEEEVYLATGGGEPSLMLEQLEDLYHVVKTSDTNLLCIYVVTNGKRNFKKLVELVKKFEWISHDDTLGRLCVSIDKYHTTEKGRILYAADEMGMEVEKRNNQQLVDMGNANKNHLGFNSVEIYPYHTRKNNREYNIVEGVFYVNYKGDVYPSCDLSYKAQERHKDIMLGNVLDPGFSYRKALIKFNKYMHNHRAKMLKITEYKLELVKDESE